MTNSAQPNDLEAVLRRVHKLLAIANDTRANPAEAAAAAGQAEKIMRKYQIEHSEIIRASLDRDDSFDSQYVGAKIDPTAKSKSSIKWCGMLSLAIAKLNGCYCVWDRTESLGVCIRYSGYKSDTQVAMWTHLFILNQLGMALRKYQQDEEVDRKQSEEFRIGFVTAIAQNIMKSILEKTTEMAENVGSRELMVVKESAVTERFGVQKIKKNKIRTGTDAYSSGHIEGQKVDINTRGISQNTSSPTLLS